MASLAAATTTTTNDDVMMMTGVGENVQQLESYTIMGKWYNC